MKITYFLVSLLATTLGSMTGLGGGVIIKPILDFLGDFNLSTISVLSSFTVFSMAIVSIIKQAASGLKLEVRKSSLIGIGSIFGGLLGEKILSYLLLFFTPLLITFIQNTILAIHLILVLIYMNYKDKFKSYNINNTFACLLVGLFLGLIASFLSIGGGPINVCVLTIFFSMSPKEAAINSIITILFSQGSKLLSITVSTGFSSFDLTMLPFMISAGILGGVIGSKYNNRFSEEGVLKTFNLVIISLVFLSFYNIISFFY